MSDPLGSVNIRASTLTKLHRIRESMSGDGKLIPLHEALERLVEMYQVNVFDRPDYSRKK